VVEGLAGDVWWYVDFFQVLDPVTHSAAGRLTERERANALGGGEEGLEKKKLPPQRWVGEEREQVVVVVKEQKLLGPLQAGGDGGRGCRCR